MLTGIHRLVEQNKHSHTARYTRVTLVNRQACLNRVDNWKHYITHNNSPTEASYGMLPPNNSSTLREEEQNQHTPEHRRWPQYG